MKIEATLTLSKQVALKDQSSLVKVSKILVIKNIHFF
jgi:hypothetical protein